jgi:hypothetical protein
VKRWENRGEVGLGFLSEPRVTLIVCHVLIIKIYGTIHILLLIIICFFRIHTGSLKSMDAAKYFQNPSAELVKIWHTDRSV